MRVLVTRPKQDADRLSVILRQRAIDVVAAPLLRIDYKAGPNLDLAHVQAVLLTSANGVRAFARRCTDRKVLALCVGDATADEAKNAGFTSVQSAHGNVCELIALVGQKLDPEKGVLLHPAGTRVAGNLGDKLTAVGFKYQREVLYEATKITNLPVNVCAVLKAGDIDGVLLYSPRTAKTFVHLISKAELGETLENVTAYCLSSRVADCSVDLPWKSVKIAQQPEQKALLALL